MSECDHKNLLQRRTQRFVENEWRDSTIQIGCADCDRSLGFKSTAYAFYTENVKRRVLPVETYVEQTAESPRD